MSDPKVAPSTPADLAAAYREMQQNVVERRKQIRQRIIELRAEADSLEKGLISSDAVVAYLDKLVQADQPATQPDPVP